MSDTRQILSETSELSPNSAESERLSEEARSVLAEGLYGMCFGPYVAEQRPGASLGGDQIEERIAIIAPHTKWVRTFSCTNGNEMIPGIAQKYGLKTMVGAWIGRDLDENEKEIESLLRIASKGEANRIAVGNEVLYRDDLEVDQLIEYINRVKECLPDHVVGCVDTAKDLLENPQIADASDIVLANHYPYWEGASISESIGDLKKMHQRLTRVFRDKEIIFTETGWPSEGSVFGKAVPSLENSIRYFLNTQNLAKREGIDIFHFSSFDEAWKVDHEGDVGPHWGLWNKEGKLKFSTYK